MKRFLKVQPLLTMQQSHQQVIVMLEPAFCSGNHRVISLLCDMLRSIYTPFPVPSTNQPAELPKEVHVSFLVLSYQGLFMHTFVYVQRLGGVCSKYFPCV